jgi:hypothetical protein
MTFILDSEPDGDKVYKVVDDKDGVMILYPISERRTEPDDLADDKSGVMASALPPRGQNIGLGQILLSTERPRLTARLSRMREQQFSEAGIYWRLRTICGLRFSGHPKNSNYSEARTPLQPLLQIIPCELLRMLIKPCLSNSPRWKALHSLPIFAGDDLNGRAIAVGHGSMCSLALAGRSLTSKAR